MAVPWTRWGSGGRIALLAEAWKGAMRAAGRASRTKEGFTGVRVSGAWRRKTDAAGARVVSRREAGAAWQARRVGRTMDAIVYRDGGCKGPRGQALESVDITVRMPRSPADRAKK